MMNYTVVLNSANHHSDLAEKFYFVIWVDEIEKWTPVVKDWNNEKTVN